jgi:hypothetical protein
MNYSFHYERLVERAKHREPPKPCERHHVVPRCMGGSDEASNLVALTPQEHFEISEVQRAKISEALSGRKFSQEHRQRLSEAASKRVPPPVSEEHRRKLSEAGKAAWARRKAAE